MLAALLLAACTVAATDTPSPVVTWDHVPDLDLAGYTLYYREPGGTFQLLRDFPCEWYDTDRPPDGISDVRFCRGPDLGAALQRWCPTCAPRTAYEFSVDAYNLIGAHGPKSNTLLVCFSPECVRGSPCN